MPTDIALISLLNLKGYEFLRKHIINFVKFICLRLPTRPSGVRPSVRSSLFGAISLAWLPFLFSCCLPPSHGLFLYGVGRVSILKEYLSLKVFRLYASPFSGQVERSLFYFACSFSNLKQCFYQILHSWHPAEYVEGAESKNEDLEEINLLIHWSPMTVQCCHINFYYTYLLAQKHIEIRDYDSAWGHTIETRSDSEQAFFIKILQAIGVILITLNILFYVYMRFDGLFYSKSWVNCTMKLWSHLHESGKTQKAKQ